MPDGPPQRTAAGMVARGWRNLRRSGGRRLAATGAALLLAFLLALFAWKVPGLGDAERSLYDLRS